MTDYPVVEEPFDPLAMIESLSIDIAGLFLPLGNVRWVLVGW
jgi:hypothetical protein